MQNRILGIDITTASEAKLNLILGVLNRNLVTCQNNRQNQIDSFELGTDQFTTQAFQFQSQIDQVTAALSTIGS